MMEITKLIFASVCVSLKKEDSFLNKKNWSLPEKLIWLIKNSLVMSVPALSYFLQNVLAYTALENLSYPKNLSKSESLIPASVTSSFETRSRSGHHDSNTLLRSPSFIAPLGKVFFEKVSLLKNVFSKK